MRQIGTIENDFTVRNAAEKARNDSFSGRARRRIGREKMFDYMLGTHEFRLYSGDKFMGIVRNMTGDKAFNLNKKFEQKFWKAIDSDPNSRLTTWKLSKKFVESEQK